MRFQLKLLQINTCSFSYLPCIQLESKEKKSKKKKQVDIGKVYIPLFIINCILLLSDCCLITTEQYFRKKTNVFESHAGEVYSIQHYVITSEQYNSVENQKIILSSVYSKDNSLYKHTIQPLFRHLNPMECLLTYVCFKSCSKSFKICIRPQRSCWGYTGFTISVLLSVRSSVYPSVCPSVCRHILCRPIT